MPTIAIIGAGFCGTMTCVHLLRRLSQGPVTGLPNRLVLIERANRIGRGVAYGTQHPLHLLNVPAAKMSALPEEPEHFLNWAKAQFSDAGPHTFAPRRAYGQYLTSLLQESISAAGNVEFQRVGDEAIGIERTSTVAVSVVFKSRPAVAADGVVLALGNYPPADLPIPGASDFYSTYGYVRDPWAGDVLSRIPPSEDILLIGTGLTMVDVVVQLNAQGHTGRIHAISRHGLLPRPHSDTPVPASAQPDGIFRSPHDLLRGIRATIRNHKADYRSVVDALRPQTCDLWENWSDRDKRQFLRHGRAYWEVHRHRIAPQIAKTIAQLLDSGRVTIAAGRIAAFTPHHGIDVEIRMRGTGELTTIHVDRVINCTGPDTDIRRSGEPLLKNLLKQGLIRPDSLGLGLDTNANGAVISAAGEPSKFLFTLGSTCKGRLWECTAVPELRQHAAHMARVLLDAHL